MNKKDSQEVVDELKERASPEIAEASARFFKTGPGQYGEGDQFLGIRVGEQRKIAAQFQDLPRTQILALLKNPYHECRLTGFLILVRQYELASTLAEKEKLFRFYVKHIDRANNWDLIDTTAHKIAGAYCWETQDCTILEQWCDSRKLWRERAAVVATFWFIRHKHMAHTLQFAQRLMNHPHDLIHKAIGWMLREVGKKDSVTLVTFLDEHYRQMPRTMLRYAIEKFPEPRRKKYLARD